MLRVSPQPMETSPARSSSLCESSWLVFSARSRISCARRRSSHAVCPVRTMLCRPPVKELGAQLLFQLHELPGERGLGDVQKPRRPGDVLFPRGHQKVPQYAQFHGASSRCLFCTQHKAKPSKPQRVLGEKGAPDLLRRRQACAAALLHTGFSRRCDGERCGT